MKIDLFSFFSIANFIHMYFLVTEINFKQFGLKFCNCN